MTSPLDADPSSGTSWPLLRPTESEVVGLLRRVARDLAILEQAPPHPGELQHLTAASHAVNRALVELEYGGD